jgi:hypothetical protein
LDEIQIDIKKWKEGTQGVASVPSAANQSPSKSNDEAAKPLLLKELGYAVSANFTVKLGGIEMRPKISALELGEMVEQAPVDCTEAWEACCLLPWMERELNAREKQLAEVLALCDGAQNEHTVQEKLTSVLSNCGGIDTSQVQKNTTYPNFLPKEKLSRPKGENANAFRATGIPDGVSLHVPLSIEIKIQGATAKTITKPTDRDVAVIKQGVERVRTMLQMFGYLRLAASIASTGRCTWFVVAARLTDGSLTLTITRIPTTQAGRLWNELSDQGMSFFLTDDGPHIIRALLCAGLDPAACRVLFQAKSSSRVYKVTPASTFWLPSTRRACLGVVARDEEMLAIKVVDEDNAETFQNECNALQSLANWYQQYHSTASSTPTRSKEDHKFYALGHAPQTGDTGASCICTPTSK